MQHVLCTGNLTATESLSMLRNLAPNVHCTRGDFDDESLTLAETKVREREERGEGRGGEGRES